MATRNFSIEDGNLSNIPLTSSLSRSYSDIDLTFANRPSGDVYKKSDAAAVKQAIKNLLLTNKLEKPFNPYFGAGLNRFLFELSEEFDDISIKEQIGQAVANYEPRASVKEVQVEFSPDRNSIDITVIFVVKTTLQVETVQVSLTRLR